MIVEDVDDNAAAMTEFLLQPLAALAGIATVLSEGVNTAVQVQAFSNFLRIFCRDGAFNKISH